MRQDTLISYADLEKLGWPQHLIDDYIGRLRDLTPQHGPEADPNGVYQSNLNGFFYSTTPPEKLWFNPKPGEFTGWISLV